MINFKVKLSVIHLKHTFQVKREFFFKTFVGVVAINFQSNSSCSASSKHTVLRMFIDEMLAKNKMECYEISQLHKTLC